VDLDRYAPEGTQDEVVLQRLGLPARFLLALGGVEARKNTRAILAAFAAVHAQHPDLSLVVAGGASLLDHRAEQQLFCGYLARLPPATRQAVRLLGVVDDADMPALYRLSAGLISPSLMEGFGLCAIEALACGRPAIVSAMAPFTEHLGQSEALWAEPDRTTSIAGAIAALLTPAAQRRFRQTGPTTAARFSWSAVARRHGAGYAAIAKVPAHA
jgi:glycosyltransferase involved in cell wall biosynthesis